MKDFIIENARPEDAAAILEYLKIVGGGDGQSQHGCGRHPHYRGS